MQTRIKQKFDLKNKVAIVTGASKGIGESIARGLAEYGAKVVISSRSQEAVEHVANNFKKEGYDALGIGCHVGDEDQLKKLVEETVNAYGAVDILVNNAATINTKAPFQLANLCYPIMKKRGGGSIINIASVEGMKPSVGLGLYSVSKAALIMLTKSQAVEWGKFGIRSNAICPGLIKTKFSSALWQNEKILDQVTRHLPAGRMAVPDEMAGLACFLASDASSYCTGSVFTADGNKPNGRKKTNQ